MAEKNDTMKDMALEGESKKAPDLDMALSGEEPSELERQLKKRYPEIDIITIDDELKIMKMANGHYKRIKGDALEALTEGQQERVKAFLASKEEK